jgi:hypothetical protein
MSLDVLVGLLVLVGIGLLILAGLFAWARWMEARR